MSSKTDINADILEKISNDQLDKNEIIEEYYKLSKIYNKLIKRYEKINKISDNIHKKSFVQNKSLEIDKNMIIKTARSKIMDKVKLQRETNEHYNDDLELARHKIIELEEKLQKMSKGYQAALNKLIL